MHLLLVTDAWHTPGLGVGALLVELSRELQQLGHRVTVVQPGAFATLAVPGRDGCRVAAWPGRRLQRLMDEARADAIHIATEGPLGWAARAHCRRRGWAFTTACHVDWPALLHRQLRWPVAWGRALWRRFHATSQRVLATRPARAEQLAGDLAAPVQLWTPGVDTRLFSLADPPRPTAALGALARPVSLYVGPITHDRQVDAFLRLDVPGSKVVCGAGPLAQPLRERHPNAHWMGWLPRHELAAVYAAADVLVVPDRHDGAGRVVLEAMARGTPVAGLPAEGLQRLLGGEGGALHEDLAVAWHEALRCPRRGVHARAQSFGWAAAAQRFTQALVPVGPAVGTAWRVATRVVPPKVLQSGGLVE